MKVFFMFFFLFPLTAFAKWKIDLSLGVDGETWKTDQAVFEEGKEKVFDFGRHIMKLSIKKSQHEKGLDVTYLIEENKGNSKITLNKGSIIIEEDTKAEIFAKGEPNQPNSIITFKFLK